ncbi:phosphinothricin acetyltransferase [Cellulosimicrobium cellulans]|uniref:GNAT family N-acetyltransferase n=1 Tax=Cellulosimicrobium cellulans TaxID=1710 RepID=UPI0027DC52CC|nr:N-acetyltransferase family protein [Cellulosimicrobium cellulans]MBM7819881.1 phosphinothricin acetyltransferase [Cellulosimicrobium cellulans]
MSTLPSSGPTTPPAAAHPTVTVRPATADDLARVAEIAAPFVRDTCVTFEEEVWDVPAWQRKLDDVTTRGLPFLVAEVDGTTRPDGTSDPVVAGYAYASAWRPKPAYRHTAEDTIYLDPAYAGRGIGTALLGALLDACSATGVRQVVSVVADVPEAAGSLPLHRRFGFVEAGRLTAVGFKHGRWVDTILLQRSL